MNKTTTEKCKGAWGKEGAPTDNMELTLSDIRKRNRKAVYNFERRVIKPEHAEAVLKRLRELVERQTLPRDIVMPIRAAIDAKAITRPSWTDFCIEFGEERISSKSLYNRYTNKNYTYDDGAYIVMVEIFKEIIR